MGFNHLWMQPDSGADVLGRSEYFTISAPIHRRSCDGEGVDSSAIDPASKTLKIGILIDVAACASASHM